MSDNATDEQVEAAVNIEDEGNSSSIQSIQVSCWPREFPSAGNDGGDGDYIAVEPLALFPQENSPQVRVIFNRGLDPAVTCRQLLQIIEMLEEANGHQIANLAN
ncbi:MAG: hypothetical protein WC869_02020 [Phycisphaerae bacterium]|jgi:hypothetical protein